MTGHTMKADQKKYICINCSHPIDELYVKYSATVSKIANCEKCHQVADKYIEFEPIVNVVIDLILLSRPAYRHVLYNTTFRIHWKLNLIYLLLDAYVSWTQKSHLASISVEHFTKEKLFYCSFGLAFIDNVILTALIYITLKKCESFMALPKRLLLLVKALCLAQTTKFFMLPIVIWKSQQSDFWIQLNVMLVMGYFLCSLIHIHSVISGFDRINAGFLVISSLTIKSIMCNIIANQMEKLLFTTK